MPINKNEFVKGTNIASMQKQILEFLNKNSDKAYTPAEIADLLKPTANTPLMVYDKYLSSIWASLDILLDQGKVIGRSIQIDSVDSRNDVHFMVP